MIVYASAKPRLQSRIDAEVEGAYRAGGAALAEAVMTSLLSLRRAKAALALVLAQEACQYKEYTLVAWTISPIHAARVKCAHLVKLDVAQTCLSWVVTGSVRYLPAKFYRQIPLELLALAQ